jgi:archaellum biogenesis protein FlaJ (TadC family)
MSGSTKPTDEHITAIYQAHSTQYENIMIRRFSLLTLVPGSTVASFAITLFSDPSKTPSLKNLILPLGLFGIVFLISLFIVARISFREGKIIYDRIQKIEKSWNTPPRTPHEDGLFNQEIVASIIFSISLAGWVCVALWFVFPGTAIYISIVLVPLLLIASYILFRPEELPNRGNTLLPSGSTA